MQPAATSTPEPAPSKSFDELINDAEDAPAAVIPQPGPALRDPEPQAQSESSEESDAPAPLDDDFYKDPLILKALEIFEGTLQ